MSNSKHQQLALRADVRTNQFDHNPSSHKYLHYATASLASSPKPDRPPTIRHRNDSFFIMADTQPAVKEEAVDFSQLKSPPEDILADAAAAEDDNDEDEPAAKRSKKKGPCKTRAMRLEQNRKAARESRKRKKVLVEELQRSVIFFSRGEFVFHVCVMCRIRNLPSFSNDFLFLPSSCSLQQPTGPSAAKMKKWNRCSSQFKPNSKPGRDWEA